MCQVRLGDRLHLLLAIILGLEAGITSSLDGIAGGGEEFRVVDSLPTGLDFLPESVTDSSGKPLFTGLYSGPYFDPARTPKNVTAQVGGAALLPCRVLQSGSLAVSWIRSGDAYILGVDDAMFISDRRFRILRPEEPGDEWNLHIKPVRLSDSGRYECQIGAESKMSHYLDLHVIVPKVSIEGVGDAGGDIHAQAGSQVALRCLVKNTLVKPRFVHWYCDDNLVSSTSVVRFEDTSRNAAEASKHGSKSTPKSQSRDGKSAVGHQYSSVLTIESVRPSDGGRYSCRPASDAAMTMPEAEVNLHVVNGETLAAKSEGRDGEAKDEAGDSSGAEASATSASAAASPFFVSASLFADIIIITINRFV